MNGWISSFAGPVFNWLADFYLAATLLLLLALLARRWVRQPAHRIVIAWTLMFELIALAVVCMLPFWPRISFYVAPPPAIAAVEPTPIIERQPMHSPGLVPLSHNLADPVGNTSLPAEGSQTEAVNSPAAEQPLVASPSQSGLAWQQRAAVGFVIGAAAVVFWLGWGAAATGWLCWQAEPAGNSLRTQLSLIIGNDRCSPRLLVSRRIATAVALGVLQPTIVLPQKLASSSPPHTLRAVLLHEWAHIRHRDLWLLAVGRCLLAVLFAHPLFWWLRRTVRVDQELLADAAAAGERRHDYAQELVRLVRITGNITPRPISAGVGIWEGSSSFSRRIAALLDETFRISLKGSRRWRIKALAAMAIVGLICSLATLQPARSTAEAHENSEKVEKLETHEGAASSPKNAAEEERTVQVAGTCVDANNRPIAGAEVCLYERKGAASFVLLEQRQTDAGGKFAFSALHLSVPRSDDDIRSFFVQARAKGKARDSNGFTSAMIRQDVWRFKLILHDAMTITGRVTDTNGKPVAGATISSMYGPLGGSTDPNCLATTDADGFYRATEASKISPKFREGLLYVRHPDFSKKAVAYKKNRDRIDFVLTPASVIEGKVIDTVTGKPAANVYVCVCAAVIYPDGYTPPYLGDSGVKTPYANATMTDTEGRYRLPVLAGKHRIWPLPRGRTARAIEAFEIKEGERRTAPDLRLIEGAFIEASVVDAETGQPPKYRHGGEIVLFGPSRPLGMVTHTFEYRPDSVIRLRVVPGMNYVQFYSAGKEKLVEVIRDSSFDTRGRKPVEVAEGQTAKVEFKVKRIDAKKTERNKREIAGRVLYHDGTPAARAAVFVLSGLPVIIGDGKAMSYSTKLDEAKRKATMEKVENKSVTKAIADADGRFRLPAGSGHAIRVAVSAPRYDLHIMQIPDDVVAKESELTIKLPEPGRLVVKYDVPGGRPQAKLFLQKADPQNDWNWPLSMMNGPDNSREPLVANKGQVVFDNLPPGKYVLARQKPMYCDLHTVVVEAGKSVTDGFVHDRGASVEGRIVGLKPGMFAEAGGSQVGATISVRPEDASDDLVSDALSAMSARPGQYPRVLDSLTCGADGSFKTERLLPGKYAIIAECHVPPDPEHRPNGPMDYIVFPAFLGRTVVTVPETGQVPPVTIKLRPYKSALQSAAPTQP